MSGDDVASSELPILGYKEESAKGKKTWAVAGQVPLRHKRGVFGGVVVLVVLGYRFLAQGACSGQALTLTFLAEWGDRSQISTIALAAAKERLRQTTKLERNLVSIRILTSFRRFPGPSGCDAGWHNRPLLLHKPCGTQLRRSGKFASALESLELEWGSEGMEWDNKI